AFVTVVSIIRRVTQMALLRYGVELVSAGTGRDLRISYEGRSTGFRPPRDGWRRVLVRPPRGPRGYVVLASRDLRRAFLPDLRDVPVDRLTRDEEIERVLPPPIRAAPP